MEFSRPSRPEMPKRAGGARELAIGRATTGASMPMPRRWRRPDATSAIACSLSRHEGSDATAAMTRRRRSGAGRTRPAPRGWSDRAATGGMATARRAGLMAETTVTPIPTTRATTTVRARTRAAGGQRDAEAFKRASRPMAASTPSRARRSRRRRPRRRLEQDRSEDLAPAGPTMRRSASSRVRWPTVIENVLKIVNPPTKSEMKANTNSAVEKEREALVDRVRLLLATVWPVTTSVPGGSARRWPARRPPCRPGVARTSMRVLADLAEHGLGRRQVEDRQVALPGSRPSRSARCPEGERLRAPGEQDRDRSPTWKWYLVAVLRPWRSRGCCPARARRHPQGGELGLGSNETPRVGAPPC